ncbi:MAG: chorismate mutase [Bacteroidales bacterium]|nr:chorismate mutase [Bacteroidales bacterium]
MKLDSRPYVIAGPCSAESEAQVMETARALHEGGIGVLRAGLWKPRTRPGCFEGVGQRGLEWLARVKNELGMKVCTEVACREHVQKCLDAGIDMVWIGARTTANPFLTQEIAQALGGKGVPVIVKNPVSRDLDLWTGAIERLMREGVEDIIAVHRGFPVEQESLYRNDPGWSVALDLHARFPQMPLLCDPSHMGGDRKYVRKLSQRAMDLGFDGLMVESHCRPQEALSDPDQQLAPSELLEMVSSLNLPSVCCDDEKSAGELNSLRLKIDDLDARLVGILSERMELSRKIGEVKKSGNVSVVQSGRWNEVVSHITELAESYHLNPSTVRKIFDNIHEASIAEQNSIISNDEQNQDKA